MLRLLNFVLFYIGWLLCNFYHNLIVGLIVLSLALLNVVVCKYKLKEVILIFILAGIGCLNDLLSVSFKVFEFSYTQSFFEWSNIWLFSLWVMFLTTFNSSLKFLNRYNLAIISICGAIGGTISYYAALNIGVIKTNDLSRTITYLIINWAILLPLLYRVYFRMLCATN